MRNSGRQPGVMAALFGDLDDDTRRRFGMSGPGGGPDRGPARSPGPQGRSPAVRLQELGRDDLVGIAAATFRQIGANRVSAVAAGITFFALLSLFPAITAFVSIYGLVADPATIGGHLDLLHRFLPEGALGIIRGQVQAITSSPVAALSFAGVAGLMAAFYSANGGMKALLSALNVAFLQRETRGFLRLNLVAMCFTLGGLVMLALTLLVVAILPLVLGWLHLPADSQTLVTWSRWPLLFGALVLVLMAIYRWGPAVPDRRWRWNAPGAVFAAVALVVVSMLFSWYAANFGHYNKTYGSLGAAVALMMWLWLSATVVLVGAELNSAIEQRMRALAGDEHTARRIADP